MAEGIRFSSIRRASEFKTCFGGAVSADEAENVRQNFILNLKKLIR